MEKVGENRMKHKKVLIVANVQGFVSDFLRNDIKILQAKGYQVYVAANGEYVLDDTIKYFNTNNIYSYNICFPVRSLDLKSIYKSYKQLKRIIDKQRFEIVHCHTPIASAITRVIIKKNIKVIYTSHGFPFYDGNQSISSKAFFIIEKYLSSFTDAIITICNEDYHNALKMNCQNVFKIPGVGIDVEKFNFLNFDREEYRKNFNISGNETVVLSIGELNTNKNHQVIIKALSKLIGYEIVYVICGKEVTEIGKKKELEDLANNLGVRVLFLGYRKDIPEICHMADIGAIPSYKEGLGLSGLEMLASGIPVVGSNRQGIRDYIIDGKTGFLCEPSSCDSFLAGIKKGIELAKKSETSKECKLIASTFTKDNNYLSMERIYNSLQV